MKFDPVYFLLLACIAADDTIQSGMYRGRNLFLLGFFVALPAGLCHYCQSASRDCLFPVLHCNNPLMDRSPISFGQYGGDQEISLEAGTPSPGGGEGGC